jgi:dihydropteroate synthase
MRPRAGGTSLVDMTATAGAAEAGTDPAGELSVRGLPFFNRCVVMGVVNVTPDSFSDGGLFFDVAEAVAHGLRLVAAGADIVDVGGESTRPGAQRVSAEEELRRTVPVVRELAAAGVLVSVDTMRAEVAEAALRAGARMVNDVSGGLADPLMVPLVVASEVPFVVMHWRGFSVDMQQRSRYADVVADVVAELRTRMEAVVAAGIVPERIIVDPGLGFAKKPEHNWRLLAHLEELRALGRPVLIGASRKLFLGRLLAGPDGRPRPTPEREDATTAVSALVAAAGAWGVRVHQVGPTVDAIRVAAAVRTAR